MNKSIKHLTIIIVFFTFLISCSVEKRLYNKGYAIEWNRNLPSKSSEPKEVSVEMSYQDVAVLTDEISVSTEELEPQLSPIAKDSACDSITMKSGNLKVGIVKEISATEIRYKNCDGTGPIYVLQKTDVQRIQYADGKDEVYATDEPVKKPVTAVRKVEGFGVAGFIACFVGLFFAGLPMSIIAVVFGMISIGRSASYPSKYKAKAFGVLSLILGAILLVVMLTILL